MKAISGLQMPAALSAHSACFSFLTSDNRHKQEEEAIAEVCHLSLVGVVITAATFILTRPCLQKATARTPVWSVPTK